MKYYIVSDHDIIEDSYENGLNYTGINAYTLNHFINAEDAPSALQKYITDVLGYSIQYDDLFLADDNITGDVMVDEHNTEANDYQIELWKKGEIKLYADCISFEVFELKQLKL